MSKTEYKEIIAFHPGYYVQDIIDDMEITQQEFAKRLGTTPKNLSQLLSGTIKLSMDIAQKLSIMTGTSVEMWANLEKQYELKIAEIEQAKKEDREFDILKNIDYNYFSDFISIPAKTKMEKVKNLCAFLHISSLEILKQPDFLVNYRSGINNVKETNIINSRAWVQTAINLGKEIIVSEYDPNKLYSFIPEIRSMTTQYPDVFLPRLKEIAADCGIAFVLLPHLKNCGINGAVKWITDKKVVLALNDRRHYADTFWFSLFHELKHIFQHKTKELIVSLEKKELETLDASLEEEADCFARDELIPPKDFSEFVNIGNFSVPAIIQFAEKIGIDKGIVVGRLQKEGHIDFHELNELKTKYVISFH